MNNTVEKHIDTINIYVNLKINSSKIGKFIVAAFLLIIFCVLVFLISTLEKDEVASAIFPIIIITAIIILFPLRYLIWNIYGQEVLIINTKSISYFYDYGIYKTNLKTINYSQLATEIEYVREFELIEVGRLIFYIYREIDNLPEEIHRTSVLIDTNKLKEIVEDIDNLFKNELLFSSN